MSESRDRIERGLRELSRRRETQAPDFDRLLRDRPASVRRAPRTWAWAWVAATATAATMVALVFLPASVEPEPEWQRVAFDWRAPTDVFLPDLAPPGLSGAPPLGREGLIVYTATRSLDLEIPALHEE